MRINTIRTNTAATPVTVQTSWQFAGAVVSLDGTVVWSVAIVHKCTQHRKSSLIPRLLYVLNFHLYRTKQGGECYLQYTVFCLAWWCCNLLYTKEGTLHYIGYSISITCMYTPLYMYVHIEVYWSWHSNIPGFCVGHVDVAPSVTCKRWSLQNHISLLTHVEGELSQVCTWYIALPGPSVGMWVV